MFFAKRSNVMECTTKWNLSTNLLVLTFSLLIYLAWQSEATKSTINNMIEASKNQRTSTLSCYACHSESNAGCFNVTEFGDNFDGIQEECRTDYVRCVVKKFAFTSTDGNGTTTPMKTFSIKRNCAKRCESGCVVMGERTRLYVCSSCCDSYMCNAGSGSGSVHHSNKSFQYFLTSVASVNFFGQPLVHMWHMLEMTSLLTFQLIA